MGMSVGKENEINQSKKNGRRIKKRRVEVAVVVVLEELSVENGECGFLGCEWSWGNEKKNEKWGRRSGESRRVWVFGVECVVGEEK